MFSGIQEFYRTKLLNEISEEDIDLEDICSYKNVEEIIKLCELVIGVVVQCDEKDEYISEILNLDEDTQADLMKIIQKIMDNAHNTSTGGGEEDSKSFNEPTLPEDHMSQSFSLNLESQLQMESLLKQNQAIKLKLADTEEENSQLKAQIAKLTLENKELSDDLQNEVKSRSKESSFSGKYDELLHRLELAERELQQKTLECSSQLKSIVLLEEKSKELRQSSLEEKNKYMDEIENLRSSLRRLEQIESINSLYKKKLEETTDFKTRMRELEEQNASLESVIEDNEREIKMNKDYRNLYQGLQREIAEEREKVMRMMVENADLKAIISDRTAEIERLTKNIEIRDAQIRKKLYDNEYLAAYGQKENDSEHETLDKELDEKVDAKRVEQDEKYKNLKAENERLKQQIRETENAILKQSENASLIKDNTLKTSEEEIIRI